MIRHATGVIVRRAADGCAALVLLSLAVTLTTSRVAAQARVRADSPGRATPRDTVDGVPRDTTHGVPPSTPPSTAVNPLDALPFLGFWAAASRHAPFRTRLGTRYHDMYLMGMRVGWTIARGRNVSLDYVVNAIPLAIMDGNPEYQYSDVTRPCPPGGYCPYRQDVQVVSTYHAVYGFGLAPLGIQLRLFSRSPVQALVHVNGGALWFARPVPDPRATHFNFTAEGGGALQWWVTSHQAISVGYEFHHSSNAATGDVNPGLNSNMLTIGVTRRRE